MAIPTRLLTATCNIDNGTLTVQNRPPVFTGESGAMEVEVSFKKGGEDYTIPTGIIASLYLYYPNTELMTVSSEMAIDGSTATGTLSVSQLGKEGYPLLIVQLEDVEAETLIVAASFPIKVTKSRGSNIVDIRPPSPSEVVYIGRSPYVNTQNNHWMEWDVETKQYVDTGIQADGYPPYINQTDHCWMVWDAENEEYVNTHISADSQNLINDTAGDGDTDVTWSANKIYDELAEKVPTTRKVNGHALTDDITVSKSDVGLGNVDNTSDTDKPISTATQTALDAKVPTSRKINNKALSTDVTLVGSDIEVSSTDSTKLDTALNTLNEEVKHDEVTVTGNPATFETDSEQLAKRTVLTFEPIQEGSGGPSPDNIRLISGYTEVTVTRTGKNLANFVNGKGIDTTGSIVDNTKRIATVDSIPIESGKNYVLSFHGNRPLVGSYSVWNGETFVRRVVNIASGTTLNTADGERFYASVYDAAETSSTSPVTVDEAQGQVEIGTTATEYEPYSGATYPITFPSEAGTVYSGQLTMHDDRTGELVVTHKMWTADGTTPWTVVEQDTPNIYFYTGAGYDFDSRANDNNGLSNYFSYKYSFGTWGAVLAYTNRIHINPGSGFTTLAELQAAFAQKPLQVLYPLANPITYQLTDLEVIELLKGINNVFSNATALSLTFTEGELATLDQLVAVNNRFNAVDDRLDEHDEQIDGLSDDIDDLDQAKADKTIEINGHDLSADFDIKAHEIIADGIGDKTVAGNPLVVEDAIEATAKKVVVGLEPIQDLHGYDAPWPAGGGKNLLDPSGIVLSGGSIVFAFRNVGVTLKANTAYTFSYPVTVSQISIANKSGSPNYAVSNNAKSVTYTPTEDTDVCFRIDFGTSVTPSNEGWQLEIGPTATAYVPYSNICPISGWTGVNVKRTGKNLLDLSSVSSSVIYGLNITINKNSYNAVESIVLNGTPTYNVDILIDLADVLKNGETYVINGAPSGVAITDFKIQVTRGDSKSNAATPSDGGDASFVYDPTYRPYYFRLRAYAGKTASNIVFRPMIRQAGTTADFEPFGITYPITFPQSAGTVYGGELTINQDGTGELVVDRAEAVYDGSSDEGWSEYGSGSANYSVVVVVDNKTIGAQKSICNEFKNVNNAYGNPNFGIYCDHSIYPTLYFRMPNSSITNLTEFKAYISEHPIQIVYELATPITYTLTATQVQLLEAYNCLFTDGDSLSLTYLGSEASNVQAEIDEFERVTNNILASIAPVETSTASASHAIGSYIMLNNQFCKVTTAIAAGETIAIGRNVTKTTLAQELLAIINS